MKNLKGRKITISVLLVALAQVALSNTDRILSKLIIPLCSTIEPLADHPVFTVLDGNGKEIDINDGVKVGLLRGMRVKAGDGFRVRKMEIKLSRGTASVATIVANGEMPDIGAWALAPGDRVIITIKSVIRTSDKSEVGFENGLIIIPII